MAAITEAALQGEWFYLVEEQSLDRSIDAFYVLREGEVTLGNDPEVVGTYSIAGDGVVLTLRRAIPFTTAIELNSTEATFNGTTSALIANATHILADGSDPLYLYGSFVRRFAY